MTTTTTRSIPVQPQRQLQRRWDLWILAVLALCYQQTFVVEAFSHVPLRITCTHCQARNTGIYLAVTKDSGSSSSSSDWFQQKPGESDVAFIKRITSSAAPTKNPEPEQQEQQQQETGGGYKRIEDWEAEQQQTRKNGDMTWEEKVQFDGQRFGNQVRQNDILMRQINSGL